MDYSSAMEYLCETQKFGMKLGLQRISTLLEYFGNPHKKLKYVHVAGTNGKGSTTAFISSILIDAGYKVGIFTSPFLQRFSERIKINEQEISEEKIASLLSQIKVKIELMALNGEHPTEFEVITVMAFLYYVENKCDIVVLEVGLGGTLDSTNVIENSEVSVITTIDYDHMDLLGHNIEEIAKNKAGIIKTGTDVVLYPQDRIVEDVIEQVSFEKKAILHKVNLHDITIEKFDTEKQIFNFKKHLKLKISLLSACQTINASVAIKTSEVLINKGYTINEQNIRNGIFNAKWAGRFEIISRNPFFVIDGAHNVQGSINLCENLVSYFPNARITFIVGVLADKDYKNILENALPIAKRFITVTPNSPRALKAPLLANYLQTLHNDVIAIDNIKMAITESLKNCDENDVICAYGSLYYIGEIRDFFEMHN
jgi:dihydrofolate synthase / folylpolyglutamate synthase